MSQSLTKIYIHLVFSTKDRYPFILNEWKNNLYQYIGGTLRQIDSPAVCIGGTADHIHILFTQSKSQCLSDIIRNIKSNSSGWIKEKSCTKFAWQGGYAAFSVSASRMDAVKHYIMNQVEHHGKVTFADEVKALCRAYNIDSYDEKFFME